MSKYFTRTGDNGKSGLLGNQRVPKDHPRLEAIGSIDEANAVLGLARSSISDPDSVFMITNIQQDLYHIMAEISATDENSARFRTMDHHRVAWLEKQIEYIGCNVDLPKEFIIPGDTREGAILDLARTIVRRAERRVSTLIHQGMIENKSILSYLNRLSSFCFVLEIWITSSFGDTSLSLSKDNIT